jgi:hypothetical protein
LGGLRCPTTSKQKQAISRLGLVNFKENPQYVKHRKADRIYWTLTPPLTHLPAFAI